MCPSTAVPAVPDRLIIFTRYPTPGTTKTRLIPALGAEGAAIFHRRMAEHTLTQARQLQTIQPVVVEVQFTGGELTQMQDWLGEDVRYRSQHSGDLGHRLTQAFENAFQEDATAVIAIGTDCPSLNSELLSLAFEHLKINDVVLGEAADGGYYLIGLRTLIPELFIGISWSTEVVFHQTLAIAKQLKLSTALLPVLQDVDRPEDLKNLKI